MSSIRLYIDLDGVLCDFEKHYSDHTGEKVPSAESRSVEANDEMWERVCMIDRFWEDMPWTSYGKKLWRMLKPYDPKILSAFTNHDERSSIGKVIWCKSEINRIPHLVHKGVNKRHVANKGDILIDDTTKVLDSWESAGGISLYGGPGVDVVELANKIIELTGVDHFKNRCPRCGEKLMELPSIDKKLCANGKCEEQYLDWKLDPGQHSVLEKRVGE